MHYTQGNPGVGTGGWVTDQRNVGEYIQADLQTLTYLYAIDTRSQSNYNHWVRSYKLKYGLTSEESDFQYVTSSEGSELFIGNTNRDSIVRNTFPTILTRYFRLVVQSWNIHIGLRWELYGCNIKCTADEIPNSDVTESQSVFVGSTVEYRCNTGFAFEPPVALGVLTATCLNTGYLDVDPSAHSCIGM